MLQLPSRRTDGGATKRREASTFVLEMPTQGGYNVQLRIRRPHLDRPGNIIGSLLLNAPRSSAAPLDDTMQVWDCTKCWQYETSYYHGEGWKDAFRAEERGEYDESDLEDQIQKNKPRSREEYVAPGSASGRGHITQLNHCALMEVEDPVTCLRWDHVAWKPEKGTLQLLLAKESAVGRSATAKHTTFYHMALRMEPVDFSAFVGTGSASSASASAPPATQHKRKHEHGGSSGCVDSARRV